MRRLLTLLALAAALSVWADEIADRVKEGAAKLTDEDAGKRDAAEAELLKLGPAARPSLEAARDAANDPEAKSRLERILESLEKPVWLATVAEGLKAAEAQGRPLIAIIDPATDLEDRPSSGSILRKAVEENIPLRSWVARNFATAYVVPDSDMNVAETAWAEGTGRVIVLFISPKNGVRHVLRGWWTADRFRKECERALGFLPADETKLAELRASARKQINDEIAANPHPAVRRHLPESCNEPACVLPRLVRCYDSGDKVAGKTPDDALKILNGER